jgi:hypothetical protein
MVPREFKLQRGRRSGLESSKEECANLSMHAPSRAARGQDAIQEHEPFLMAQEIHLNERLAAPYCPGILPLIFYLVKSVFKCVRGRHDLGPFVEPNAYIESGG